MATAILINVRDRPTELALLLQSLRTQTYQDFDIFIMDDQSGTPLNAYHFLNCMINRLKMENHKVFIRVNPINLGVTRARQEIVDWALEGDYEYLCRVDDDIILEPEYLDKLFEVINQGYDLASGVTVPMLQPNFIRDPKFIGPIVNRVILDEEGNYIFNGDDCGMEYTDQVILPAHHFRSCALYKSEIHKKANYLPTPLSKHGFREEQIFSYRVLMAGYKIGVNTRAINYHQITPSGGERPTTNMTGFNQEQFEKFTKDNKDQLRELFPNEPTLTYNELQKETNLIANKWK